MRDKINVAAVSATGSTGGVIEVDLSGYGHELPSYRYHDHFITPGDPLILPEAFLKWYELRPGEERIPHHVVADARTALTQEVSNGAISFDYGLGFVVLHYSPPLVYLIVGSWRANQEFRETHYIRDLNTAKPFELVKPGENAPTLCVWELAPVWHERQAWTHFLGSRRDITAKRRWVNDSDSRRV